jgi:hypothetical protein
LQDISKFQSHSSMIPRNHITFALTRAEGAVATGASGVAHCYAIFG